MHSSCKRDQTGAAPVVGSISSPVAQPVERPTLNREVDGANPSGAATSSPRTRAASCAGRSIRRSPHRHCGGRRGRTAPAHHFINAPVAQCIEHRASNAEVAGEIPAGSTTHFSRRSPTQRQRAQTSSSAGASPAAGTTFAPVAQCRGSGLKPRSVSVRIRPGALSQRPRSPTAEASDSKPDSASANLAAGTNGT